MENYSKLGLAPAAAAAYECIQVILGSLYIEQELGANSKLMSAITLAASTFFFKKILTPLLMLKLLVLVAV